MLSLDGTPIAPSSAPTPSAATPRTPTSPIKKQAGQDFAAKADSIGLGGPRTVETEQFAGRATQAWGGSNHDVVANRRAIRMANMSAAEVLKAELASLTPVKPSANAFTSASTPAVPTPQPTGGDAPPAIVANTELSEEGTDIPGLGAGPNTVSTFVVDTMDEDKDEDGQRNGTPDATSPESPHGVKRKHNIAEAEDEEAEEAEGEVTIPVEDDDDAESTEVTNYALKVNPDGTVEQEDTVRQVKIFYFTVLSLTDPSACGNRDTESGTTNRSSVCPIRTLRYARGGSDPLADYLTLLLI